MNKRISITIASMGLFLAVAFSNVSAIDTVYAGLRCSPIGFNGTPTKAWIANACKSMSSRFTTPNRVVIPCVVWIAGEDGFDDATTESYLTYFDNASNGYLGNGVKVLLQVQPFGANVRDLIDKYVKAYAAHPCFIGFGVDVEWNGETDDGNGEKVTDATAKLWKTRIKLQYPGKPLLLMLKHFFPAWMPPTEREGILFLDDSQQFPSFERFLNETNQSTDWNIGYKFWSNTFKPASPSAVRTGLSGMQYGYDDAENSPGNFSDKDWWIKLKDPQKEIGDSCLAAGVLNGTNNTKFLFWVDFTAQEFDWTVMTGISGYPNQNVARTKVTVHNRTITVQNADLQKGKSATMALYNYKGKLLMSKTFSNISQNMEMSVGYALAKGNYLLRVKSDNRILSKNRVTLY